MSMTKKRVIITLRGLKDNKGKCKPLYNISNIIKINKLIYKKVITKVYKKKTNKIKKFLSPLTEQQ